MKVGILTLVPYDNYGGILQGYALKTMLERMGHDVTVMNTKLYNYVPPKTRFKQEVKWLIKRFILHRKDISAYSPYQLDKWKDYRVSALKPFIDKQVHLTRTFSNGVKDIANFAEQEQYDAFVVGSDQTWRPELSPDLYHLFCDFVPANSPVKRIAYAASFGVDKMPLNQEQLAYCKPLLQRFKAVTLREASGIELCNKYFGVDAKLVLDPTLLLDKSDYMQLISEYKPTHPDIRLLQYVFFWNHEERSIIDKVSSLLNSQPTNLFPEKFLGEINNESELPLAKFQPLEEWLYAYSKSEFVVTDSFHGTVFCIIFNVPFLVVSPEAVTRFKSLLGLFGLEDRLIMKAAEVTPELLNRPIDWEFVNQRRRLFKTQSIKFLQNALKVNSQTNS